MYCRPKIFLCGQGLPLKVPFLITDKEQNIEPNESSYFNVNFANNYKTYKQLGALIFIIIYIII